MVRRREISDSIRELIVKLKSEGKSLAEISKIVGRPRSSVQTVLRNYNNTGTIRNKSRNGRPALLSVREKRYVLNKIKQNPKNSAVKIAQCMELELGKTVHAECVRRVLRKSGYNGRSARRKPYISEINRKKRLEFAEKYANEGPNFWDKVLFTDETKINLYQSDGRVNVWRQPNTAFKKKNVQPTVKHGGQSVLLWGCMSAAGVGNMEFIDGIMDKHKYVNILKANLIQSANKLELGEGWIFQQDHDPKHTSYLAKEWLLYNVPKQLNSPPQSPDINPIEHLWAELKRRLSKRVLTGRDSLKRAIVEEWAQIPNNVTQKLVYSMQRRLNAVISANGGVTKY